MELRNLPFLGAQFSSRKLLVWRLAVWLIPPGDRNHWERLLHRVAPGGKGVLCQAALEKQWRWKSADAWRWAGTARRSGPVSPGGVGWCAKRPCPRSRVVWVVLTDNDALLGSGDAVPWAGRFMDGVTCDDMSGEVHIKLLSHEDTREVGSYVPCSRWEMPRAGRYGGWWITCVGLRAGRSVEQDYERVGS